MPEAIVLHIIHSVIVLFHENVTVRAIFVYFLILRGKSCYRYKFTQNMTKTCVQKLLCEDWNLSTLQCVGDVRLPPVPSRSHSVFQIGSVVLLYERHELFDGPGWQAISP